MLIKLLVRDVNTNKTWPEVYDTDKCKLTSGMDKNLEPIEYGETIVEYWNGTLRPHENPREILKGREISYETYKLKESVEYDYDAPASDDTNDVSTFDKKWNDNDFIVGIIVAARNVFSNPETTREEYTFMQRGLEETLLKCSDRRLLTLLESCATEAKQRRKLYICLYWENTEDAEDFAEDLLFSL